MKRKDSTQRINEFSDFIISEIDKIAGSGQRLTRKQFAEEYLGESEYKVKRLYQRKSRKKQFDFYEAYKYSVLFSDTEEAYVYHMKLSGNPVDEYPLDEDKSVFDAIAKYIYTEQLSNWIRRQDELFKLADLCGMKDYL